MLAHERRRIVHFAVTAHPTAEWTVQQLREAFPWDAAPRYLLRDRDRIFGADFVDQVKAMGIQQVLSAPRSPWQRAYVERVIGTIRRECLDHMILFNERCLYRHLQNFVNYYHRSRTRLASWRKTVRSPDRSNGQMRDGSSRFRRWVGSIIVTTGAPPEPLPARAFLAFTYIPTAAPLSPSHRPISPANLSAHDFAALVRR